MSDFTRALGAAIEFAAGNLIDGDTINIMIENGGNGINGFIRGEAVYPDNDNMVDDILELTRLSNPDAEQ